MFSKVRIKYLAFLVEVMCLGIGRFSKKKLYYIEKPQQAIFPTNMAIRDIIING